MILSLKTASNISSSVPHEESPSPLKGLQNLRKLTIFNSTNPTNHSIPQSKKQRLQFHNSSYEIHLNHDSPLLSFEGRETECCRFHERKDVEGFD